LQLTVECAPIPLGKERAASPFRALRRGLLRMLRGSSRDAPPKAALSVEDSVRADSVSWPGVNVVVLSAGGPGITSAGS